MPLPSIAAREALIPLVTPRRTRRVRERVDDLRRRFSLLLGENDKLPQAEKLPREAFYVDPGLQDATLAETAARLEEAKLEMAFDSEKVQLARSKLEDAFLRGLVVENIALKGFANGLIVRSFRTTELAGWLREAMEHVHALIDKEAKTLALKRSCQTSGMSLPLSPRFRKSTCL